MLRLLAAVLGIALLVIDPVPRRQVIQERRAQAWAGTANLQKLPAPPRRGRKLCV